MPSVSTLDAILQQVLAGVNGLGLQLNSQPIPASISKLPKREEKVDPPVQIAVCINPRGESTKAFAFGPGGQAQDKVTYPIMIVLIAPNNNDQVANLQAYTLLRQKIRLLYRDRTSLLSAVSNVFDCNVKEAVFLDAKELAQGYDYMAVQVDVDTIE